MRACMGISVRRCDIFGPMRACTHKVHMRQHAWTDADPRCLAQASRLFMRTIAYKLLTWKALDCLFGQLRASARVGVTLITEEQLENESDLTGLLKG